MIETVSRLVGAEAKALDLVCKLERIKKIRPALEHPHTPTLACMQAGQRGGDGGLALAGGGRGDEQRRTAS